ncbi:MAG: HAMP domain-containing protein [Chloroflexi bacterium]|nr:HAMP domain-containing protein [Chloroflexota bacterium]
MKNIKWGLGFKLFLAFAVVALTGVGAVALITQQITASQFTLYVNQGGSQWAVRWAPFVEAYYQQTGGWTGVEALFAGEIVPTGGAGLGRGGRSDRWRFVVTDPAGVVMVDTAAELVGQRMSTKVLALGVPLQADNQPIGTLIVTTGDPTRHTTEEQSFLDAVNAGVLGAALLAGSLALVAAALVARSLTTPLRRLTQAAHDLARGNLTQRVVIRGNDEVADLGQAFNSMAESLETAAEQRRQMTADIAHELRTPLSIVQGELEALLDGVYPLTTNSIEPIYQETRLLSRLVADLRELALADAGELRLERVPTDLGALVAKVLAGFERPAADKGVALTTEIGPGLPTLDVDPDRIRQVLANLLDNALRHTPAGGRVTVQAASHDGDVLVSVRDTGPGIAPADLPHVFERFYRGDRSRARVSGGAVRVGTGTGLGLAIARSLIEAHGGHMWVESVPGQGAAFHITLGTAKTFKPGPGV